MIKKRKAAGNRGILWIVVFIVFGFINSQGCSQGPKSGLKETLQVVPPNEVNGHNQIRVLTWPGYVSDQDLLTVNSLLKTQGYDYEVTVLEPLADNAQQMYNLIRADKCDVSFLTLFFIKMQGEKLIPLLQPINVNSPRLSNYRFLLEEMTSLSMGIKDGKVFYIPFGGGPYGFYADTSRISPSQIPQSYSDLLSPEWEGKFSLNISQPWYNVYISLMTLGKNPFLMVELFSDGQRAAAVRMGAKSSPEYKNLEQLYKNSGNFWTNTTEFDKDLLIVSSWGPEINFKNSQGENWQLINFKEGQLVWLDTINFTQTLAGKKLEAAEIFANYMIGKTTQTRLVEELSMFSVSHLVERNPLLNRGKKWFVPPLERVVDNLMKLMSDKALESARVLKTQ